MQFCVTIDKRTSRTSLSKGDPGSGEPKLLHLLLSDLGYFDIHLFFILLQRYGFFFNLPNLYPIF